MVHQRCHASLPTPSPLCSSDGSLMFQTLRSICAGLRLLRHPELVADLGRRQSQLAIIRQLKFQSPTCRISNEVVLTEQSLSELRLGEAVSIGHGCVLTFGDEQNGIGKITVGSQTWIGPYNNLRSGGGRIEIGCGCLISQFCTLVASHHGTDRDTPIREQAPAIGKRDIRLGDDVWLGAGVTVTAGSRIGTGAVIGAGSVVIGEVPEYEIWAGSPARKIGERKSSNPSGVAGN
ncbi:hypothetical protein CGZ80_00495 [Rhodopirellula sp. MGV]|nr:hypothetical protein CGZ80_00495 [Rhodopirellula sp. MGV]